MKKFLSTVLALMMILSSVSMAAPVMVQNTISPEEAPEINQATVASEKAELTAATSNFDPVYGYLLYNIDFETDTEFKSGDLITSHGYANPDFMGTTKWTVLFAGAKDLYKTTENGNTFLRFTNGYGTDGKTITKWPQLYPMTPGSAYPFVTEDGYFTFSADARRNLDTTDVVNKFDNFSFQGVFKVEGSIATGNVHNSNMSDVNFYTLTKRITTKPYNAANLYRINYAFSYSETPTHMGKDTFDIDNVKLYYMPKKAEITILGSNGVADKNVTVDIADTATLKSTFTKAELIALIPCESNEKLVDLTLADGSSFESVNVFQVNQLKGVYRTYDEYDDVYGHLLYHVDFENSDTYALYDPVTYHGYANPDFMGDSTWVIRVGGDNSKELVTENGNTFFRFTNGASQWPQLSVLTDRGDTIAKANPFASEDGYYTVSTDVKYKIDAETANPFQQYYTQHLYTAGHCSTNIVTPGNLTGGFTSFTTKVEKIPASKNTLGFYRTNFVFAYSQSYNAATENIKLGKDTFDIDNIKLYFKPKKVNVEVLGTDGVENKTYTIEIGSDLKSTFTKAELLKLMPSLNGEKLVDLTLTDGSSFETIDVVKVQQLKGVYRKYETLDATYGHLLYHIDFETSSQFKTGDAVDAHGYVNPEFLKNNNWTLNIGNDSNRKLVTENGNTFLRFNNGLSYLGTPSLYPQIFTSTGASAISFVAEDGFFTVNSDVRRKIDEEVKNDYSGFFAQGVFSVGGSISGYDVTSSSLSDVNFYNYSKPLKDTYDATKLYRMNYAFSYSKEPKSADVDVFDIDNLKLYFKPKYFDVTVLGGTNTDFEAQTVTIEIAKDLISTISKEALMEKIENNTDLLLSDLTLSDGTAFEEIDVMFVNEVKAVWKSLAPESYNVASIRVNDPSGIRFLASVTEDQKAKSVEYGFIVTLARHLGENDATALTMDSDFAKVTGISYGYDSTIEKNVDKIYKIEDSNIFFTAAIYGIPESKANYEEDIIVRPYLKDTNGAYYYAEPIVRSVIETAQAIKADNYEGLDDYGKAYVDKIISVCEG